MTNGTIKITTGISGDEQESSFMNATLNTLENNLAFSVAVHAPNGSKFASQKEIEAKLREDFKDLVDKGWDIEVQIGVDSEEEEDDDDFDINDIDTTFKSIVTAFTADKEAQKGFDVTIDSGIRLETKLTVFHCALEEDNPRVMVSHGNETLLQISVDILQNEPQLIPSVNARCKIIRFDTTEVHIKLTDEGVVVDVFDLHNMDTALDSTYLFHDEMFEIPNED